MPKRKKSSDELNENLKLRFPLYHDLLSEDDEPLTYSRIRMNRMSNKVIVMLRNTNLVLGIMLAIHL